MVSFTRCWTRRPLELLAAAVLLLLVASGGHAAGIETEQARFQLEGGIWVLDADLHLDLTPALTEALESGVALRVEHSIRILSRRSWWRPDSEVARLTLNLDLTYHALTQRYLLYNHNSGHRASYANLHAALGALQRLRDLPVIDAALLPAGQDHYGELRSQVAVDTLPLVLRPMDWFTNRWQLSSNWTAWPLET